MALENRNVSPLPAEARRNGDTTQERGDYPAWYVGTEAGRSRLESGHDRAAGDHICNAMRYLAAHGIAFAAHGFLLRAKVKIADGYV